MQFSSEPVVSIQDASIFQDEKTVLANISFSIKKGEFVYVIGRTGSGKSSLLKTLYADLEYPKGTVNVAGFDIPRIKRSEIPYLRRKIGIIFQDFQLLEDRTIAENLYFVLKATGWKNSSEIKQRITDVLIQVGLGFSSGKMPHQLSGGEQQRVVVARALLNEPQLLIADEPTGNLDPEVAESILQLFLDINKSGTAILMATHNYDFLKRHPARVLRIEDDKIIDSHSSSFI
ncbi:MAG: transporter related protein [Cytophagaceae bacterium]|jgi:cell division transport system ATP-binding protein|nr:transporter related protein [Cytophagaceae bacterium]